MIKAINDINNGNKINSAIIRLAKELGVQMNFDEAYLSELKNTDSAYKFYNIQKAEQSLRNLLKHKYGKVEQEMSPEQIFQLEGTGRKVLQVKHKDTGAKMFAIVSNDSNLYSTKKEIKKLGFKIKR